MPRGTNSVGEALEHQDAGAAAAQRPPGAHRIGRRHDRRPPMSVRASPAVITLPVTSTPEPPEGVVGPGLGQLDRLLDAPRPAAARR